MTGKKGKKRDYSRIKEILGWSRTGSIHEFLLNSSKVITIILDRKGKILFVNRPALKSLGYSEDEVIGKSFRKFLSRKSAGRAEKLLENELKGNSQPEEILEARARSGDKRYLEFSPGSTLLRSGNRIKGIILCAFDITKRMKKGDELKLADDVRLNIIREAPFGIYVVNQQGVIEYANSAMCRISGIKKKELEGINTLTLPTYKRIGLSDKIKKGLRGKAFSIGPLEYTSHYGKKRTIRNFKGIPLREDGVSKLLVVVEDLTKQKEAEEELVRSENRHRFIAENINDVICIQNLNLDITYVSPSIKRAAGYSPKEVVGGNMKDFMTSSSYKRAASSFRKALKKARKKDAQLPLMEYEYVRKDGSTMWGELKATFLRDSDGNLTGLLGVIRDITERKKAEDKLKESEEKFRLTFENALDAIIWADPRTGRITNCNRAAEKLIGMKRKDIIGRPQKMLHPPELRKEALKRFRQHSEKGGTIESKIITSKGERVPVSITASTTFVKGEPIAQGIFRDIRDRKKAEKSLKESEERFRRIYEQSPIGIEIYNAKGGLLHANKACLDIFGVSDISEVKDFNLFSDPNLPEEARKKIIRGEGASYESYFDFDIVRRKKLYRTSKSGKIWVEVIITSLALGNNKRNKGSKNRENKEKTGYLVQVADITKEKEAENLKAEELKKLQGLDRLKTHFLTLASHELKNPLTPMLSQLQMLEDGTLGGLNKDQQEGIEIIHKSADHLVKLVDDILDISRLEAGRMKFDMRSININNVIRDVCNAMAPSAKEKGISLKQSLKKLPKTRADPFRIRQVLLNYLSNAIKFTNRRGRIYVSSESQPGRIIVRVTDTGIGVKKEEQHKIFAPFFQAQEVAGKKKFGFGLGLTTSKGIIEGHNGEIGVDSRFSRGSTFWFTLPLNNTVRRQCRENKNKKEKIKNGKR